MADEEKDEKETRSEVEILATALADTNREVNTSSRNTTRVLGTLLVVSICGNIALSGLAIKVGVFGSDINMGGGAEAEAPMMEDIGYFEEMPDEGPPAEWCAELKALDELHPDDEAWCKELYPELWAE
jgi:hypothetical protein